MQRHASNCKETKGAAVALIAEKVETQEEYKQACKEGFTYFRYYFAAPCFSRSKVPPIGSSIFESWSCCNTTHGLEANRRPGERDASLAYRCCLVNSPICAIRQEVRSIEAALVPWRGRVPPHCDGGYWPAS